MTAIATEIVGGNTMTVTATEIGCGDLVEVVAGRYAGMAGFVVAVGSDYTMDAGGIERSNDWYMIDTQGSGYVFVDRPDVVRQ